jgi:thiosulfate dehydrogenase
MKILAPALVTAGIIAASAVGMVLASNSSHGAGIAAAPASGSFTPPQRQAIPKNGFGDAVRLGQNVFDNPQRYASKYVGNSLRCSNCHLDAGRLANSAPMWAAYVSYPAYRSKNKHVNTFAERLQGCFRYSMNGKAPPLGDPVLVALESYSYWLATGAPIDSKIAGRGYPAVSKPPLARDYARGHAVFAQHCALCHGVDGQGQSDAAGRVVFPPLWGPKSFNWGAGMGSIKNASEFIKANMPLGWGGSLSDQQAWDVATYMDSQERPQDPRFKGSIAETRAKYHDSPNDMYGLKVNGHWLGQASRPAPARIRAATP